MFEQLYILTSMQSHTHTHKQMHIMRAPAHTGVTALLCYPGANLTVGKECRADFLNACWVTAHLFSYLFVCVSAIVSAQTATDFSGGGFTSLSKYCMLQQNKYLIQSSITVQTQVSILCFVSLKELTDLSLEKISEHDNQILEWGQFVFWLFLHC